jgi:hypothetical protein
VSTSQAGLVRNTSHLNSNNSEPSQKTFPRPLTS